MTVPLLVFSAVLLALVFHGRVSQNDFSSSHLAFPSHQATTPNAYLVRISATTLTTIASWSSTLAPILIGFGVTLISYPVAKGLLTASDRHDTAQLPTPFQLSLIVTIISAGSFSALWKWLQYVCSWRSRREKQGKGLRHLTFILLLGIILSLFVVAADTWLHFTTKTIVFTQVHNNLDASGLGFGLTQNCTNVEPTLVSCNVNNPASGSVLLHSEPMRVLSNISDAMVVPLYSQARVRYAYVANPQTSRLAPLDYQVLTYALATQCNPVTTACTKPANVFGAATTFQCPFAFQGSVSTAVGATNSITEAYFSDLTGSSNDTTNKPAGNPYSHAAILVTNMRSPRSAELAKDPEALAGGHGGATIIVLLCTSTVYDVSYSSVNGTIVAWEARQSNQSNTMIVQGTQRLTDVAQPNLVQAISVAGLSNSTQDIADQFALAYSQNALAAASGAFEPRSALASQTREPMLVARVPKAPLYALVLANLLLVLLGMVLTIMALLSLRGETGEIQARLSISMLVAALFEGRVRGPARQIEDMFAERHKEPAMRLGFSRSAEEGYVFQTWMVH